MFVGRERELSSLHAQLERARAGEPRLVSIEGPAGIGKTALVRRFLSDLADEAWVLRASGEENESLLPYGVLEQLVQQLPAGPLTEQVDPLEAGSTLLSLLGDVQDDGPVVVVVDDAHWADVASLHALAFVLRRLRIDHILAIVITRDVSDPRLPEGLRRVLADDGTLKLSLDGLEAADLRVLSEQYGPAPLAQRAADRLRAHTDGNPLHAKALLEQIPAEVLGDLHVRLPAPRSYELLVLARLATCKPAGRTLVEAVSVLGRTCPLHEASRLGDVGDPLPALEEVIAAGLLLERPGRGGVEVGFTHPLIQAAVYQTLGPAYRSHLHLRAAELVEGESARLRHRLRAADRPDQRLAAEVADAGRRCAVRGLWAAAAEHMSQAARLADTADERVRLTAEAIEALLFDGQIAEAAELAGELPADVDPSVRDYALGAVAATMGRVQEADRLLLAAWDRCDQTAEPVFAARIAEQLTFNSVLEGRGAETVIWAERALRLAPDRPGADLTRYHRIQGLVVSGRLDEGLRLTEGLPDGDVSDLDALLGRGLLLMFIDDLEAAVRVVTRVVAASRDRSMPFRLRAMTLLSLIEFYLGRWDGAVVHAEAATSIAASAHQVAGTAHAHGVASLVPSARGDWEWAEVHVQATREVTPSISAFAATAYGEAHLGSARGDAARIVAELAPFLEVVNIIADTALVPWHDRHLDALIAVGELDQAEAALIPYETLAATLDRCSALAAAGRVRGNLSAARGDPEAAEAAFQGALAHAAAMANPFDRARLALDYGSFLRRQVRRADAIVQLDSARAAFARLGARPYSARCERELAACGRRPAHQEGPHPARLTPQEQAVARLVASGLTNRQVAAELVVSVKTVEYHLARVYSKLDVNSRAALATKLAAETTD